MCKKLGDKQSSIIQHCSANLKLDAVQVLGRSNYVRGSMPSHQISLTQITNYQEKEQSYHQNINVLGECGQPFSRCTLVMQRTFHLLDLYSVTNHAISTGPPQRCTDHICTPGTCPPLYVYCNIPPSLPPPNPPAPQKVNK